MKNLYLFILGVFALTGLLVPQAVAQDTPRGIPSQYKEYYEHAKAVLEKEDPSFLTAFQTLQEEIQTVDITDTQAQFEALMRFIPAIEDMNNLTSFDRYIRGTGYRTLQCEVIFTFFAIALPTADGHTTTLMRMFCDAFMLSDANPEVLRMLTQDEIMKKHGISAEEAQQILNVWEQLHRDWPW